MDENNNNVNETDITDNSNAPVPAYHSSSDSTNSSSEKSSEANTYPSYTNVASEPAEFSTGFAVASLVMGILSILTCCCCGLGILMSILGIIFGCVQPKDEFNKKPSMAVAGIITSIIGILAGILIIILFVSLEYLPKSVFF